MTDSGLRRQTCAERPIINLKNPHFFIMAKYEPNDLLKSLHGKVCQHSDTYFAERYGTKYTGKICRSRTTPPSEAEVTTRTKFADVNAAIAALTEEEKNTYAAAYKKNRKGYKTLRGYIFAELYKKTNL